MCSVAEVRIGCERRISHLKRNYGWGRTMIDTTEGARNAYDRRLSDLIGV